jgi:Common central domain of tyrosinase
MAFGDGIRRNIAHVSAAERKRFRDAVLKLDRDRFFSDGVSYFDKQEEIHKNAHAGGANVHGGPAFIPWHRELCNRFEALLREVDPDLSLHYWDWTTDPRSSPDGSGGIVNLLTPDFMGVDGDPVGPPFDAFESTEPGHSLIWRDVGGSDANPDGTPAIPSDANVKNASDFAVLDGNISGPHGSAHFYIGGTLTDAHFSFHDPFVFLLHSNLDRLWAEWQTEPGHPGRLEGATAYGSSSAAPSINEDIQPWAGAVGAAGQHAGGQDLQGRFSRDAALLRHPPDGSAGHHGGEPGDGGRVPPGARG